MIAGDVGMKVEPDALYAILVWAIGRQKVEHDAPVQLVKCALGSSTLVDEVVPHDEVDSRSVGKALGEVHEQLAKEAARLLVVARGVDASREHVERTGDVELLVLARRQNATLVSAKHPARPIFGFLSMSTSSA